MEEEGEHRENEFAEQCAGFQSNNYSTRSFHCVSWEAESSHSQFQFIFIEAIVSILVGAKRSERDRGRAREMGNGMEGNARGEETERDRKTWCMKGWELLVVWLCAKPHPVAILCSRTAHMQFSGKAVADLPPGIDSKFSKQWVFDFTRNWTKAGSSFFVNGRGYCRLTWQLSLPAIALKWQYSDDGGTRDIILQHCH